MNIEIANRLFELRKQHGLSQEALAERLGISRQAVSKWERAEASPDTDNLLRLAELYDISLDELLLNRKQAAAARQAESAADEDNAAADDEDEDAAYGGYTWQDGDDVVRLGAAGIHVKNDREEVRVGWDGIHVHDGNGERVHIDKHGIFVEGERLDEQHIFKRGRQSARERAWHRFPFWLLAVVAFLLMGFLLDLWAVAWLVFLTIPLYHTLVSAIFSGRPSHFAFPVLVALVYLYFGMFFGLWHPSWIMFLLVPLYYWLCSLFEKEPGADGCDME